MDRFVHYSLALPRHEERPDLLWQLSVSLRTLREHNDRVPVGLFLHGPMTPPLAALCREHDVMVHEQGPYEERLARLCPGGWQALAEYPLLHKFLNFAELAATGARQVLFLDCDTVFLGDVERLFDGYDGPDLVAREEVHSSRSIHGVDRTFIDEPLLARLAAADGAATIPPFNLGVVLFNHGIVRELAPIEPLTLDYAWRLTAGALPFPSTNWWILDEVALWLALGHAPPLETADFDPRHVVQNGEFERVDPRATSCVLCHYYSQNTGRIAEWLRAERMAA
ncbi:MAG: hypothetical protein M3389_14665 [Actinomycetota bacterium]|nr:hypothetical protein [Actinomycetota bacterium]